MKTEFLRRTLPGIALVAGLMAMALSCGGSMAPVEEAAPAAAPQAQSAASAGADAPPMPAATIAAAVPAAQPAAAAADAAPRQPAAQAAMQEAGANARDAESAATRQQSGRQLIVEAWMTLEVTDVDPVARQVETVAIQRGGWVESAEIFGEGGYRSASINIRVPAGNFDAAMASLRSLGRVTDEGVGSTDVTARLIDNEARLVAWRSQEERLIHLLDKAETLEHVIDLEKRLAEVRTDIELVAATQRNLENRVAASLIQINLHLPQRFAADPPNGVLTLAVGDPSATADAIVARVELLNGYVGEKREYQQDGGEVVDVVAFVKSADLAGLMDYAATLGEPSGRQLNSVGPSPVSDVPNARLTLGIRSNVDLAASLHLSAAEPLEVAGQIRERAQSLGGFVEQWNESRNPDHESVNMELVVKSSDLRELMDFGASLGDTEYWEYNAVGQNPVDDAPNARLSASVSTMENYTVNWLITGVILVFIVAVAGIAVATALLLRRRRGRRADAHTAVDLEPDAAI